MTATVDNIVVADRVLLLGRVDLVVPLAQVLLCLVLLRRGLGRMVVGKVLLCLVLLDRGLGRVVSGRGVGRVLPRQGLCLVLLLCREGRLLLCRVSLQA